MTNVCFTGHRNMPDSNLIENLLKNELISLIKQGATDFYAGGALGWDMLCEKTVLLLKKQYPNIKLHMVLPCPCEIQTSKWKEADIKQYMQICESADSITVLSEKYYDGCMKQRNKALVSAAECCVCYYNSKNFYTGTGQTVRMAIKKNIPIINLYEQTMSVSEIQ